MINNFQILFLKEINLKERYIEFLELPRDITAIEIKSTDAIYKY